MVSKKASKSDKEFWELFGIDVDEENKEKEIKKKKKLMKKLKKLGTKQTIIHNRKTINKNLRELVWFKHMGNKVQGKCYCCKIKPIHFTDFEVGHNKAVSIGGQNNIENLRPICRGCNKGMKTKSIEWYKKKYFDKPRK